MLRDFYIFLLVEVSLILVFTVVVYIGHKRTEKEKHETGYYDFHRTPVPTTHSHKRKPKKRK